MKTRTRGRVIVWHRILLLVVWTAVMLYPIQRAIATRSNLGILLWSTACVDCPDAFDSLTNRSLKLDASGHPHIAYGGEYLYYAGRDDTTWQTEIVDSNVASLSLALNEQGYPRISYIDKVHNTLKYAYRDDLGWHTQTIDNAGTDTSLSLDGSGYPHIGYYANSALKYAYQDTSGWHIETADFKGAVGPHMSLVVDSNGYPHISYGYDSYPDSSLKYAYKDVTGWHTQTLETDSDWMFSQRTGRYTSLALDDRGYARISYYNEIDNALRYAYQDQSGWHIQPVDAVGVGSLVLDRNDYAHVSYYDGPSIRYTFQDASGWHPETVVINGYAGLNNSLTLDQGGYAHIMYTYSSSPYLYDQNILKYTYQDYSGWHTQIVDSIGKGWINDPDMILDHENYSHISYGHREFDQQTGYYSYTLKYVYQDATGWHSNTVDSGPGIGFYTSLDLDDKGFAHISYIGTSTSPYQLKYAYQNESGWHTEVITTPGNYNTSLQLDENGFAHISYGSYYPARLQYAFQDSAGWHFETVDDVSGIDAQALVLDAQGKAQIIYYTGSWSALKYAYRDMLGWHTQLVDNTGSIGSGPAMVLDKSGYLHVTYTGLYYTQVLKYAYQNASGWHIEIINDTGKNSSVAVDSMGYAHISYYDAIGSDLKYIHQVMTIPVFFPLIYR